MGTILLTREDIRADIVAYKVRIQAACDRLAALPATAPTWKDRKKITAQRRTLNDEIQHVTRLLGYIYVSQYDKLLRKTN